MTWERVTKFDRRAVALADRHYSRQQPGTPQFLPPGRTMVLLHESGRALWACVENMPPGIGAPRQFRNAIFRSEGAGLASDLIRSATAETMRRWRERYGEPAARLTTEVDPARVRAKRNPGWCFIRAGWELLGERRGLLVFGAP